MKFKFWNGLYCLCWKMGLTRACWWIFPRLMGSMNGTTVNGFTVVCKEVA